MIMSSDLSMMVSSPGLVPQNAKRLKMPRAAAARKMTVTLGRSGYMYEIRVSRYESHMNLNFLCLYIELLKYICV